MAFHQSSLFEIIKDTFIIGCIEDDSTLSELLLSFESDIEVSIYSLFLQKVIYHPFALENKLCFIARKAEKLSKNNHEFIIFYKSMKNKTAATHLTNIELTPFTRIKIPEEYGDYMVDYCWISNNTSVSKEKEVKFVIVFTDSYYLVYELPSLLKNISINKGLSFNSINITFTDSTLLYAKPLLDQRRFKKHFVIQCHNKLVTDTTLKYVADDDIPWKRKDALPYTVHSDNYINLTKKRTDTLEKTFEDEVLHFPLKYLALEALGYQLWWKDITDTSFRRLTVDVAIDSNDLTKFGIYFDSDIYFEIVDVDLSKTPQLSLEKFTNIENDPFVKDLWQFLRITKRATKLYHYIKQISKEIHKHEHSIEKFWKSAETHYETDSAGELLSDLIKYISTGVCKIELKEWILNQFSPKHVKKYQKHLTDFYFKAIEIQTFYQAIDVLLDTLRELETFLTINSAFASLFTSSGFVSIANDVARLRDGIYEVFKTNNRNLKMRFSDITRLHHLDQQQHLKFFDWLVKAAERISKTGKTNLEAMKLSFKDQMCIVSFMDLLNKKLKVLPKRIHNTYQEPSKFDEKTGFNSMNYFIVQTRIITEEVIGKPILLLTETHINKSLTPIIKEVVLGQRFNNADVH